MATSIQMLHAVITIDTICMKRLEEGYLNAEDSREKVLLYPI